MGEEVQWHRLAAGPPELLDHIVAVKERHRTLALCEYILGSGKKHQMAELDPLRRSCARHPLNMSRVHQQHGAMVLKQVLNRFCEGLSGVNFRFVAASRPDSVSGSRPRTRGPALMRRGTGWILLLGPESYESALIIFHHFSVSRSGMKAILVQKALTRF